MALATRCPNCEATFRVVADQLKLRGGLVRCGTCRAVFDAIGTLAYVEDGSVRTIPAQPAGLPLKPAEPRNKSTQAAGKQPPPAAMPTAPPNPIDLRIKSVAARPAHTETLATKRAEASGATARRKAEPQPAAEFGQLGVPTLIFQPEAMGEALPDLSAEAQPFGQSGQNTREASPGKTALHQAAAQAPTQRRAHPPTQDLPQAHGTPEGSDPVASNTRPAHTQPHLAEPQEYTAHESANETELRQGEEDEIAEQDEPAFLIAAEKERRLSIFFTAGSAVLTLIAALQLSAIFRSELLVQWPALKPALVQLCRGFDCRVTWPEHTQALAVVGTELRSIPGTDVMELAAVIRNRAHYTVALPAIEVTLTDTQSRPIARKVFTPADYLASAGQPSSRIEQGLASGSDYTVRITFEARALRASGFVIYPFYF